MLASEDAVGNLPRLRFGLVPCHRQKVGLA